MFVDTLFLYAVRSLQVGSAHCSMMSRARPAYALVPGASLPAYALVPGASLSSCALVPGASLIAYALVPGASLITVAPFAPRLWLLGCAFRFPPIAIADAPGFRSWLSSPRSLLSLSLPPVSFRATRQAPNSETRVTRTALVTSSSHQTNFQVPGSAFSMPFHHSLNNRSPIKTISNRLFGESSITHFWLFLAVASDLSSLDPKRDEKEVKPIPPLWTLAPDWLPRRLEVASLRRSRMVIGGFGGMIVSCDQITTLNALRRKSGRFDVLTSGCRASFRKINQAIVRGIAQIIVSIFLPFLADCRQKRMEAILNPFLGPVLGLPLCCGLARYVSPKAASCSDALARAPGALRKWKAKRSLDRAWHNDQSVSASRFFSALVLSRADVSSRKHALSRVPFLAPGGPDRRSGCSRSGFEPLAIEQKGAASKPHPSKYTAGCDRLFSCSLFYWRCL